MFEKAARLKLRFQASMGLVTAEDLWDLSVQELDSIFKALNKQLKTEEEESLLATKTKAKTELQLKVDILKHVVNTKLEEKEAKANRAAKRAKRNELLAIMADKQNEELKGKSLEDLQKELDALEEED